MPLLFAAAPLNAIAGWPANGEPTASVPRKQLYSNQPPKIGLADARGIRYKLPAIPRNEGAEMRPMRSVACMCLSMLLLAGCQGMGPNWTSPGTLFEQRSRATINDPYPDNDLGPPVVGVRPREFEKPESEVNRSRAWDDNRRALGF